MLNCNYLVHIKWCMKMENITFMKKDLLQILKSIVNKCKKEAICNHSEILSFSSSHESLINLTYLFLYTLQNPFLNVMLICKVFYNFNTI